MNAAPLAWNHVTLEDKKLFEDYLKDFPHTGHEYTFANFFSWRGNKHHRYAICKNHLLVADTSVGKNWKLYEPIGPSPHKIIQEGIPLEGDYGWSRLSSATSHKLITEEDILLDRNNHDYVYRVDTLQKLEGKYYDGKRNFIKRFKENYNPVIKSITKDNVQECYDLSVAWGEMKNLDNDGDLKPLLEIIKHFDRFDFEGIGVYVEDKMVGFVLGEALNNDTFGERYEKGFTQYTGIYQFLLNAIALHLGDRFTYINREQDLGLAGLRKSKLSWGPDHFSAKYCVAGINQGAKIRKKGEINYWYGKVLNKESVEKLYKSCEWSCIERCPEKVHQALDNSDTVISAWDGDRLVGLGNAISDTSLVVYFPHLLVDPEYQKQGIGQEIMRQMMQKYESCDQKIIISHEDAQDFYEKLGFQKTDPHPGMWIHNSTDL